MKVINVKFHTIYFEDGTEITSNHEQDCCESHYLSFGDLTLEDFDGLEFDITDDKFFEQVSERK